MLNADQFGQGPNVPTQRFLARLAFILNYTHLESIFTSLIQEAPCKTLDVIIANSLTELLGQEYLLIQRIYYVQLLK